MKHLLLACLTAAAVSMGFLGTVSAGAPVAKDVVILRFDTFDVDQGVMDNFYSSLYEAIAGLDSMGLGGGGDVSMQDLLLMAGCDDPTPDCLAMLRDFVDGDHLLFGSVQRSDDVHMFSLHLFDFESGQITHEVTDQTLRGDESWLARGIPAVIEHLFFGKTASLHIEITGQPETEVRLNGDVVGKGTMTVDNLAPGEVVVVVTPTDGNEEMERTIVRHNQESRMEFEFDETYVARIERPAPSGTPSLIPGFVLTGVGVGGLVVGILGNSQLAAAESEANTFVGGRSALAESELTRAQELQDRMNSAHTLRVVGLSAGTIGLAAGGALLFRALTSGAGDDTELAGRRTFDVDFGASSDGVNAGFRIGF